MRIVILDFDFLFSVHVFNFLRTHHYGVRRIMKYILTILIVLLLNTAYASELKRNSLSTEISPFSGVTIVTDYYTYLVKIFSKAYRMHKVQLKAVVTPSFRPEYMIGVRQSGNKYYAFKRAPAKSIWAAYEDARQQKALNSFLDINFDIKEAEVEISRDMFAAIENPWTTMTQEAKHQDIRGLDGTTYHFSSGLVTASTWSPEPESHAGYLAKIVELLGQLTEIEDKGKIEKNILETATRLSESLK